MRHVNVEEEELLAFFEKEPNRANQDPIWLYDDSVYEVESDGMALSFAIQPSLKDVRLILSFNGKNVYEFNSVGVKDVYYSSDGESECLQIELNDNETIELSIKPTISIQHRYKG